MQLQVYSGPPAKTSRDELKDRMLAEKRDNEVAQSMLRAEAERMKKEKSNLELHAKQLQKEAEARMELMEAAHEVFDDIQKEFCGEAGFLVKEAMIESQKKAAEFEYMMTQENLEKQKDDLQHTQRLFLLRKAMDVQILNPKMDAQGANDLVKNMVQRALEENRKTSQ